MNQVAGWIGFVDQDQFSSAKVFRIVFGFTFGKLHRAFARQHVSKELA